jgi:hypothetical protein
MSRLDRGRNIISQCSIKSNRKNDLFFFFSRPKILVPVIQYGHTKRERKKMLQLFIAFYVGSIIVFWLGNISIALTVASILKSEGITHDARPDRGGLLAAITASFIPFVNTLLGLGAILLRENAIDATLDRMGY